MTPSVLRCPLNNQRGLIPTRLISGEVICSHCGEVNPDSHEYFEFIGAFCPIDLEIHYRWINIDWTNRPPKIFRKKTKDEPLITPIKTEHGIEKYFLKQLVWDGNEKCLTPDYIEVLWTGIESNNEPLLRPADTGYSQLNRKGIHAPVLAALFEWLLLESSHLQIAELAKHCSLPPREKNSIIRAVTLPTPSNIFNMLWVMHRLIPGWHYKRSLGRRSPSLLLQDEIRWTTNRLEDLNKRDRDRLLRCGPEQEYWGSWQDLWPSEITLGNTLSEFGPNLKMLGIDYGESLKLIANPNKTSGGRSWVEVAVRFIHWPLMMKKGGIIDLERSAHLTTGFMDNLQRSISVSTVVTTKTDSHWFAYIMSRLPLCWIRDEQDASLLFTTNFDDVSPELLQQTLLVLEPWFNGKCDLNIGFIFQGKQPPPLNSVVSSFTKRINSVNVSVEFKV
ncbi:MAG: hypothetical protein ACXADH_18700 [Candidatus Kariarchaeaceae archaeon]